jgi:ArsR family transcriptional regulator, virulence genes transcriptional regulator
MFDPGMFLPRRSTGVVTMNVVSDVALNDAAPLLNDVRETAKITSAFLKSLSHPARLMVLWRLSQGPARVGELEQILDLPQAEVSKHLARLRTASLVKTRRDGRNVFYSLHDDRTSRIIQTLNHEFGVLQK